MIVPKAMKKTEPAPPGNGRGANDRKPREKRWQEILKAAAEVFYEKGYDAATLQEIADRVGILKGSIYYYIKTKSDLLDHLLTEVHNEGVAMIRQRSEESGTVFDKLEAMFRSHIDYMCRNQAKTTVYLHELKALDPKRRESLFRGHEFRDQFLALIKKGQAEGLILDSLDPKLTAQTMMGWTNSLYQWYRPQPRKPMDQIANHFVTIMLRGIATAKGLELLRADR
ncbi:TetR/AcrR family transcriptional regulator [Sphingosinicella microcystinivorans]|uniref:TetR/AcrR family transcriptional regulator n=1 Tax=Sphingosinicella microcystinivorans TaxID=335406 RepID=UPI0022F39B42|nr:TetR/AcrR family transcriptional regulator [Sphingosinicella microcystinivorans]WBX84400.1 TetR/AcrR family transcriptional regulator [Sphingosinicella microcystinivorans]